MIHTVSFDRFRPAIEALPVRLAYSNADLLCDAFRLFEDSGLACYYAPFHRMNRGARVALIGLTPGWTQMELAYRTARIALAEGLGDDQIFAHVELAASFGGPMRSNLVSMLDGIGMHVWLGLDSCAALFEERADLVHFTSLVSAPTFKRGENYTGYGPAILEVRKLREFIRRNLVPEIDAVPGAVLVPLGKVADQVVTTLIREGAIDASRPVVCLPHPSGANGHRRSVFERNQEQLRSVVAGLRAGGQSLD